MNELYLPRHTKVGVNSYMELGRAAKDLNVSHVFIVTGSLVTKEPFLSEVKESITKNGLEATFFSGIRGEPTSEHLKEGVSKAKSCKADCIVAIGGGSIIDLAKAISVLTVHKGMTLDSIPEMENLNRLPIIAVPTTAGTGSEATKVTVITDIETNIKRNPGHYQLIPDIAILDPVLTVSLPKQITAYTGLDALAHAIEAYVSTKATAMSNHFAHEAIRLIGKWLPEAYKDGDDLEARENMLLGSFYAGVAFSNSSTNLAHAAARPLGARFHIPHGLSVSLLMPFVIDYGLGVSLDRYADIGNALGCDKETNQTEKAHYALDRILDFNEKFQIWVDGSQFIKDHNGYLEALPLLIEDALSGNGIMTNRKIPNERDIEKIYLLLLKELEVHQGVN